MRQRQIATDAAALNFGTTMSPQEMTKILEYLVSRLPEDQLAELDALREGGIENRPAMDAALGDQRRRDYLSIGPSARNAIRRANRTRLGMDAAGRAADVETFPHADRLGIAS